MLFSSARAVILWGLSVSFFASACSLYILISLFVSPRRIQPFARKVCAVTLRLAGQRLHASGAFPPIDEGPYLYVFNHTSLLDTFIVVSLIPEFTGAVGKVEQFSIPIWGAVLRRWGAVGIERDKLEKAVQTLGPVEESVRKGTSLLVAPEGTRSASGELGLFKKGPFHIAKNTQCPIVPIVIDGAFSAKNRGDWRLYPSHIRVHIDRPVRPVDSTQASVEELRDLTRQRFVERLVSFRRE